MTDGEKLKEAERVLADLPKQAKDLTRRELVIIVDYIQKYVYSNQNGKRWNCKGDENTGLIENVKWLLGKVGLVPDVRFHGQSIFGPYYFDVNPLTLNVDIGDKP